jgi:hypothetical protein
LKQISPLRKVLVRSIPASGFILLCALSASLQAANKLDIGAEYRFRGIQLNNPTYTSEMPIGSGQTIDQKYYSHRARVYLKGKLDPGIEIGSVIQAIGVSGSTAALVGRPSALRVGIGAPGLG